MKIVAAVESLMNIPQALVGDVRVKLRGCYGLVAEQLLDAPQVGAVRKKIGSVAVAKDVGGHLLGDAGGPSIPGYQPLDGARRQTLALRVLRPAVDEQRLVVV